MFPGVPYTGATLATEEQCYILAVPDDFLVHHRGPLEARARIWGDVTSLGRADGVASVMVEDRWVVPGLCGKDELVLYVERIELL